MKNVTVFCALALFCLLFAGTAQAQNKFGHINTNELLQLMPERAQAETALQEEARSLENQLATMTNELKTAYAEYEANLSSMNDLIRKTKEQGIRDLEQRIQDFQADAQGQLQVKEQELLNPIVEKARKAIKDVADENGYTYVFDSGVGVLLHFPPADDIMPMVKAKLNITATLPAEGTNGQ